MKPSLVLIGLGNPGAGYVHARHNVGFQALDVLAAQFGEGEWRQSPKFHATTLEARVVTVPVLLVKPDTFMNRSGECVRALHNFYRLDTAQQVLVVVDDIDLPLGQLRFRARGGPGTHNGMRSIVDAIGEEFPRVRIGVGAPPAGADLATWVLSAPPAEERAVLEGAYAALPEVIRTFVLGEHDS